MIFVLFLLMAMVNLVAGYPGKNAEKGIQIPFLPTKKARQDIEVTATATMGVKQPSAESTAGSEEKEAVSDSTDEFKSKKVTSAFHKGKGEKKKKHSEGSRKVYLRPIRSPINNLKNLERSVRSDMHPSDLNAEENYEDFSERHNPDEDGEDDDNEESPDDLDTVSGDIDENPTSSQYSDTSDNTDTNELQEEPDSGSNPEADTNSEELDEEDSDDSESDDSPTGSPTDDSSDDEKDDLDVGDEDSASASKTGGTNLNADGTQSTKNKAKEEDENKKQNEQVTPEAKLTPDTNSTNTTSKS